MQCRGSNCSQSIFSKSKQSAHILLHTPLRMVGWKHWANRKLRHEAEGQGGKPIMHWAGMVNSEAEREDCLVQFANRSGVGRGDRSFCPIELKCKPTQKELRVLLFSWP